MTRIIFALLFATLTACANVGNLQEWPARYAVYMTTLTKAYTAASVGMIVGKVSKEEAAKVLREMADVEQLAAAGLLMWGPVADSEKLAADHLAAKVALESAVK